MTIAKECMTVCILSVSWKKHMTYLNLFLLYLSLLLFQNAGILFMNKMNPRTYLLPEMLKEAHPINEEGFRGPDLPLA